MFTACTLKEVVINDKSIDSVLVSQRLDGIGNGLGKQRSKTKLVCSGTVQKTIESVLAERFLERTGLLLHVHASSSKGVAELVFENLNDRNAFLLLRITLTQKISNLKSVEK